MSDGVWILREGWVWDAERVYRRSVVLVTGFRLKIRGEVVEIVRLVSCKILLEPTIRCPTGVAALPYCLLLGFLALLEILA